MTFTIGDRIRKLRRDRGLTVRDVAEGTGIDASRISIWENSKAGPSKMSLEKLSEFYEVNLMTDPLVHIEKSKLNRLLAIEKLLKTIFPYLVSEYKEDYEKDNATKARFLDIVLSEGYLLPGMIEKCLSLMDEDDAEIMEELLK